MGLHNELGDWLLYFPYSFIMVEVKVVGGAREATTNQGTVDIATVN